MCKGTIKKDIKANQSDKEFLKLKKASQKFFARKKCEQIPKINLPKSFDKNRKFGLVTAHVIDPG